jgi:hypothetical protein
MLCHTDQISVYLFIYLEASSVAQTVSNNTVISEQCIGNVVKERYCTLSQFPGVNLKKGRTTSFRTDDVRKDMSILNLVPPDMK